jgi:hypothetical protein
MNRFLIIFAAAALALLLTPRGLLAQQADNERSFTIEVVNRTPDTKLSHVVVEYDNNAQEEFAASQDGNTFTRKLSISDKKWFYPLDIKITWEIPAPTGVAQPDFYQRFDLLVRYDYPFDKFVVPVFYEKNIRLSHMDDLDALTDPKDQYQVFFSAYRIYEHYATKDPSKIQGRFLRRVATKWFEAAKSLALDDNNVFQMSEVARSKTQQSFNNDPTVLKRFADRGWDAASIYWFDLKKADSLSSATQDHDHGCKLAATLLGQLGEFMATPNGETEYHYRNSNNPDAFSQMNTLVTNRCH